MRREIPPRARQLLRDQDGVISAKQLAALGCLPHDIKRWVRRRELSRAFAGILVDHTGPLTPRQREWVAVLTAWPAALTGASAIPELRASTIEIAIEHGRTVKVPRGVRVLRARGLSDRVRWDRSPPRVRPEHAVLDHMSDKVAADDVPAAFHALAQVIWAGRATPDEVIEALERRRRLPGRALIRGIVCDVRDGAFSVLERQYLHKVERAHGLPRADRQRISRATGRTTRQDVPYPEFGVVIELDGDAFHRGARRDSDAFRDLSVKAKERADTVRVGYGLAFRMPCRTAALLAEVLQERGWTGSFQRCGRCRA